MTKFQFELENSSAASLENMLDFTWNDNMRKTLDFLRSIDAKPLIVGKRGKFKIIIWSDEHPPPHFHVQYDAQEASFAISDGKRLPGTKGLERYESQIIDWWKSNRRLLVETWNRTRPSDCPVGPIFQEE